MRISMRDVKVFKFYRLLIIFFMFEIHDLFAKEKHPSDFIMGAIGDSITAGVNSTGWGAQLKDSWATGLSPTGVVESHYKKLQKQLTRKIKTVNVARGGSSSVSLNDQLEELLVYKPDYITFFIGSNDVCQWSENYEDELVAYKSGIDAALQRIIKKNSDVKILLLPVPNLYSLWKIGKKNNCQWIWNVTGLCHNLLGADRSQEQRISFKNKVSRVNQSLHELADVYKQNVKFNIELFDYKFNKEHLSKRDCFHPSGEGQDLISRVSWKSGWFGEPRDIPSL